MKAKRAALKSLVLTALQVHEASFKADERLRDVVLYGKSGALRNKVMGNPVRYAAIIHRKRNPPAQEEEYDAQGKPKGWVDEFNIQVWYAFKDHASQEHSSTEKFDDIMFADSTGLIDVLVDNVWVSNAYDLSNPFSIETDIIPLDSTGKNLSHWASLNVTMQDYS